MHRGTFPIHKTICELPQAVCRACDSTSLTSHTRTQRATTAVHRDFPRHDDRINEATKTSAGAGRDAGGHPDLRRECVGLCAAARRHVALPLFFRNSSSSSSCASSRASVSAAFQPVQTGAATRRVSSLVLLLLLLLLCSRWLGASGRCCAHGPHGRLGTEGRGGDRDVFVGGLRAWRSRPAHGRRPAGAAVGRSGYRGPARLQGDTGIGGRRAARGAQVPGLRGTGPARDLPLDARGAVGRQARRPAQDRGPVHLRPGRRGGPGDARAGGGAEGGAGDILGVFGALARGGPRNPPGGCDTGNPGHRLRAGLRAPGHLRLPPAEDGRLPHGDRSPGGAVRGPRAPLLPDRHPRGHHRERLHSSTKGHQGHRGHDLEGGARAEGEGAGHHRRRGGRERPARARAGPPERCRGGDVRWRGQGEGRERRRESRGEEGGPVQRRSGGEGACSPSSVRAGEALEGAVAGRVRLPRRLSAPVPPRPALLADVPAVVERTDYSRCTVLG